MKKTASRTQRCSWNRRVSRRNYLQVGAIAGLGLSLPQILQRESLAATAASGPAPPCHSVIQIYLPGGIAHQELVDPKPAAPAEYRGELDSIETVLPGVRFNELMQHTAKVADRLSVVRSMTHTEAAHERGTHNMITGYRPSPAIIYPSMGSLVVHELGARSELPPYVCVPNTTSAYSGSGYLSSAYGPFSLGGDPARRSFKVRDLDLPDGVDKTRFEKRKRTLDMVDKSFRSTESDDGIESMVSFYERAYSVLGSEKAVKAFDISEEDDSLRDRYGRNSAGARMLMARRLIESGVRFVSLSYGAWDTHTYHFRTTLRQLPPFDQAFAALIGDLDERGMLEQTMVVVCSEFGRTPMVNAGAGRDHWPRVFSTILAGGGLKRGYVHGESDAIAAEPKRDAVTPEDFACTIYKQLGIEPTKELMAPGDRPLEIVEGGTAVDALVA
jgi:hypothetical protein